MPQVTRSTLRWRKKKKDTQCQEFCVQTGHGNPHFGALNTGAPVIGVLHGDSHTNPPFQAQNPQATQSLHNEEGVPFLSFGTLINECVERLC